MTTKEYLEQLRGIDVDIVNTGGQAQHWMDIATRMGHPPMGEKVDSSPKPDQMENAIIKAIECSKKAEKEADRLIRLKERIENQIVSMKEHGTYGKTYYYLLWGTYHDNKKLAALSDCVDYSYAQAKRLYKKALICFEKRYGDTYLNS